MLRRSGKGIITRAKTAKPCIHIKKRKDDKLAAQQPAKTPPKPPKPRR